jgi:hypothetical protein
MKKSIPHIKTALGDQGKRPCPGGTGLRPVVSGVAPETIAD